MLVIKLRFAKEIWNAMLALLDEEPATKVFINFEEGVMSTSFLFFNDINESEWTGYITGINTIHKIASYDEGNMHAFRLQEDHIFEIRDVLEYDYEPILQYQPRRLYARHYGSETLSIESTNNYKYNHRGN